MFTRAFALLWTGQFVSIVGTGVAGFGLSVWVYQDTGSAAQFAAVMAFATLPMVLLWPVAGLVADRWGRREAMLLADTGAGAVSCVLLALLYTGGLDVWHVYVGAAAHSVFSAFQWPAYSAAIPDLIPAEHLGRANGLVELSVASGRVLGPFVGGALLATTGLGAILLIDISTFLFAIGTLLALRIPRRDHAPDDGTSRLVQAMQGWTYIRRRRGLLALIVFFVATNFTSAIPQLLLTPLILSFASEIELGTVLSLLGIGMVSGGLLMTASGGPKQLVAGIVAATTIQGLAFVSYGLTTSIPVLAAATFIYGTALTIIRGTNQTLWQREVPADVLGRVMSFRSAITGIPYPVAFLTAGVLADQVFTPAVASGGWLSDLAGVIAGPAPGTALLIVLSGLLTIAFCAAAWLSPRLRQLEDTA